MKRLLINGLCIVAAMLGSVGAMSPSYACGALEFARWCAQGQQVEDARRCVERVQSHGYTDFFNRCNRDIFFAWCWDHNSLGPFNLCSKGENNRPQLVCDLPTGQNAVFINEDSITYWVWDCS